MIENQPLCDWLSHMETLHGSTIDMGLERMQVLTKKLDLINFNAKVITVGGTNGKGSVVKTLESIYCSAGYSVAAYTSPHLLQFNERLRINGELLSDAVWIKAFASVEKARGLQTLSFFEYTTLSALLICRELDLDIMILEVGLGGRLDAVNVVESDLAIVTNVDIDHIAWLGDDREAIGFEKAGIFRQGKKAVCGDSNPPQSLLEVAKNNEVELYCYKKDYFVTEGANNWRFNGPSQDYVSLPLAKLKLQNVATAIMAVELLGVAVTQFALISALGQLKLPGRYEIEQHHCPVFFDVAHNAQSARFLAAQFQKEQIKGRRYAVVGMRKDKDVANMLTQLMPHIDSWYVGTVDPPRGTDSLELAKFLSENGVESCYNFDTIAQAIEAVFAVCEPLDAILVFGSFHTVADAKRYLITQDKLAEDKSYKT